MKIRQVLSDLNETQIFSTDLKKNIKIQNFMKIRQVGAELFHADGQTDITKLAVAFRNFAKRPKNDIQDHNTFVYSHKSSFVLRNILKVNLLRRGHLTLQTWQFGTS